MTVEKRDAIDAISTDRDTGDVILTIIDPLPWDEHHIAALEEKVNAYVDFIQSGQIFESYPKAKGRQLRIEVVYKHDPTPQGLNFLRLAQRATKDAGIDLVFHPLTELGGLAGG